MRARNTRASPRGDTHQCVSAGVKSGDDCGVGVHHPEESVRDILGIIRVKEKLILCGALNKRIGIARRFVRSVWCQKREAGKLILKFCKKGNLFVTNTMLTTNKFTSMQMGWDEQMGEKRMIDLFLVDQRIRKFIFCNYTFKCVIVYRDFLW